MRRLLLFSFVFLLFSSLAFANTLSVQNISPVIYDEQPAVAIVFDKKIDVNGGYDDFITITSPVGIVKSRGIVDKSLQIIYYTGLQHSLKYNVSIKNGLKGMNGLIVSKMTNTDVTMHKLKPSAWFTSSGLVVVPSNKAVLPISVSNIETILVSFYKTTLESINRNTFTKNANKSEDTRGIEYIMAREGYTLASSKAYAVNALNKQTTYNIEIPETLLSKKGVYLAVIQSGGEFKSVQTAKFIISDIGLHVIEDAGNMHVWARSLTTGKPLENVYTYVNDLNEKGHLIHELGGVRTDKNGYAMLSFGDINPLSSSALIMGTLNDDTAVVAYQRPLDISAYDIDGRDLQSHQIFIYGPRDLYRGGEVLKWNVLLRNHDGNLIDTHGIDIKLIDSQGEKVDEKTVSINNPYGLYEYSYEIADNAPTGLWRFEVGSATHYFSVEDFIPETMRLTLGNNNDPLIVDKTTATSLTALGEYLYGAPAAGNTVDGTYELSPAIRISGKWQDYIFAAPEKTVRISQYGLQEGKLNKEGYFTWNISEPTSWTTLEKSKTPINIKYFITLYESGGRAINRVKEYIHFPSGQALGIKADFKEYASTSGDNIFRIININSKGEPVKAKVSITLIKDMRNYYWEYHDENGWKSYFTSTSYPVTTVEAETGDKPIEVPLRMDYGYYKAVVKNLVTGQETEMNFRAGAWWYDSGDSSQMNVSPESLKITFDKPAYPEGSTAKVTVTSPYDGIGTIVAETTEGVQWQSPITVKNNKATIDLPVSKDWNSHDVYVSAYIARSESELEKAQKGLVYGITYLPIDRENRRIELDIIRPDSSEPDTEFEVIIRAKNAAAHKDAMVTLAAVDQGILALKQFYTPNPWYFFFSKKRHSSTVFDNFWQVVHKYSSKMATRYGGDADLMAQGGALARADVNIISILTRPVKFDEKGEARIKLKIDSFNGELALMALAFSANSFGSAESSMRIAQPIVTELAVPRFLATGDKVTLALDLRNMTDNDQNIAVSADVTHPLKLAADNLTQQVPLAQGAKGIVRIPVEAVGSSGYGSIKVNIAYDNKTVAKTWRIAVRPAYPAETYTKLIAINPKESVSLLSKNANDIINDSAYMSVDISTMPPLGIASHFTNLLQYPYGCLEQTVSSTFPLVLATDAVRAKYGMALPPGATRNELVMKGLDRIYGKKLSSGAFGYWDSTSHESAWGTVYAAEMLNEAKKQGFTVREDILQAVNNRLAYYIRQDVPNTYSGYYDRADQFSITVKAYAAYVLAKYTSVSLADIRDVFTRYAGAAVTDTPLLHLAVALKKAGDTTKASEALYRALMMRDKQSYGYYGDYSSGIRNQAWGIVMNNEYDSKSNDSIKRIHDLALGLENKSWLSTQERIRLLMAAMSFEDSGEVRGNITVNKEKIDINTKKYSKSWGGKGFIPEVSFTSNTDTILYAKVDYSAYTKAQPAELKDNANVTRKYYDEQGNQKDIKTVTSGEFVVVELSFSASVNSADGLVVDFLPAGFEIENQNLDNSRKLSEVKLPSTAKAPVIYSEFRDDRFVAAVNVKNNQTYSVFYIMRAVTPGEFINPTPYFEDMYRGDIRAIGTVSPSVITVMPK